MTRPITVLAAIAGFVTTAELAHAQPVTPGAFRKEMVASGVLMQPQGDFQRALQTIGYGGGFHGLIAIGSGLVSAGADSQLMFYARDGRNHDQLSWTRSARLSSTPMNLWKARSHLGKIHFPCPGER